MDETEMGNCFHLGADAVIAGRLIFPEKRRREALPAGPTASSEREHSPAELLARYTDQYCLK